MLLGSNGKERVSSDVGAFHPDRGALGAAESGRGAKSDAVGSDPSRASLSLDAGGSAQRVAGAGRLMLDGRQAVVPSSSRVHRQQDGVDANGRPKLP